MESCRQHTKDRVIRILVSDKPLLIIIVMSQNNYNNGKRIKMGILCNEKGKNIL